MTYDALPGGELVSRGLRDIAAGRTTDEALLVMIGAPRLRGLGIDVTIDPAANPEADLYDRLALSGVDSAHSRYNALVRQLVSFERALQSGAR